MDYSKAAFLIFSLLALYGAMQVILAKNPVTAVLHLVVTFIATAMLWLSLEAEFLAITLIVVYVGAVMVLFLFVVMMLNVEIAAIRSGFAKFLPLGLLGAGLVVIGLFYAIDSIHMRLPELELTSFSNTKMLGVLLFSEYLLPFIVAGFILLAAIVAAICLTFRGARKRINLNVAMQLEATKENRLKVINMEHKS